MSRIVTMRQRRIVKMSRIFAIVALVAILGATLGAVPVLAAKGGNGNGNGNGNGGGKVTATITIAESNPYQFGEQVTFAVEANLKKQSDFERLSVANWCFQNGEAVYADFQAVVNGLAGPFTLGPTGSWTGGAADCHAYVYISPFTHTPVNGGEMTYNVEP